MHTFTEKSVYIVVEIPIYIVESSLPKMYNVVFVAKLCPP